MHRQVLRGSVLVSLLLSACAAPVAEDDVSGIETGALEALPLIAPSVLTPSLHSYDDAPRTADSDDPAIWINPKKRGEGLVIGALKDAGLEVYDLRGRVLQTIVPAYRLPVSASDPKAPGPQPDPGTGPCPDSASGEVFGRFNNVDVAYDVVLRTGHGRIEKIDIAVVTDRGCDRLRIFRIDPQEERGPLVEITASDAPRVFPKRFEQPSPVQSPDASSGLVVNDLDDQSTAYGLTLYRPKHGSVRIFTTQRRRAVVAELELVAAGNGRLSYRRVREYRFDPVFDLPSGDRRRPTFRWTPCREEAAEDPQFEGLVVDQELGVLYASQEVVGVWRIPLDDRQPPVVKVPVARLYERTKSFGASYYAVPDEDEFACETSAPDESVPGTAFQPGRAGLGGQYLAADVEGLAIYYRPREKGYLLASSQGDDTFHVFRRTPVSGQARHLGSFLIEGTGETDGHDVVNVRAGDRFPFGLFVSQNGKASGPASEEPINGYEYDNSTQFELIGWEDIAAPLGLAIDEDGYDPRSPKR